MSKTVFDFNRDHPERRPDEVFVTNAVSTKWIGWQTKRCGRVAYGRNGQRLDGSWPDAFPVFVKQHEVREKEGERLLQRMLPQQCSQ